MDKQLAANFKFTIPSFRKTPHGGIILNLLLPESEAVKALALGLQEGVLFEADIFIVQEDILGGESAE